MCPLSDLQEPLPGGKRHYCLQQWRLREVCLYILVPFCRNQAQEGISPMPLDKGTALQTLSKGPSKISSIVRQRISLLSRSAVVSKRIHTLQFKVLRPFVGHDALSNQRRDCLNANKCAFPSCDFPSCQNLLYSKRVYDESHTSFEFLQIKKLANHSRRKSHSFLDVAGQRGTGRKS